MIINDTAAHEELKLLLERYENALGENRIEELDAMFWQSDRVIRFGVAENLYGDTQIAMFRRERAGGSPPRRVKRIEITTFGSDFGVTHVEFQRSDDGPAGRQSQTWVRFAQGWRIVSAHVSFIGATS